VLLNRFTHLQHFEADVFAPTIAAFKCEDQVTCFYYVGQESKEDVHALKFNQFLEHLPLHKVDSNEEDALSILQEFDELSEVAINQILCQSSLIFKELQETSIVSLQFWLSTYPILKQLDCTLDIATIVDPGAVGVLDEH
jgi:hypothetical protein